MAYGNTLNGRAIGPSRQTRTPSSNAPSGTFATISLDDIEDKPAPTLRRSAAPPPPPPKRFRYSDLIRADGTLDTEALYRIGQVPDAPVSAEKLLAALVALPADLPVEMRRIALRAMVIPIIQAAQTTVDAVREDALLRRTRIQQYYDGLTQEQATESAPLRREIAELEATLTAKKAMLARQEAAGETGRNACSRRLQDLEEVIAVLTEA